MWACGIRCVTLSFVLLLHKVPPKSRRKIDKPTLYSIQGLRDWGIEGLGDLGIGGF